MSGKELEFRVLIAVAIFRSKFKLNLGLQFFFNEKKKTLFIKRRGKQALKSTKKD